MPKHTLHALVTGLLVLGVGVGASAQRREGKASGKALVLKLSSPVKFGDVVVEPHRYRVIVTAAGLALVSPSSMVTVATVPVEESTSETSVDRPSILVEEDEKSVEIIVLIRDRIYRARGEKVESGQKRESRVVLTGKTETALGKMTLNWQWAEQKTERELIGQALKRYHSQVKHCADKVKRSRWKTDDRRFRKCLCPMAKKWRLPRVKEPMRVHYDLAKGQSGFSLTVSPQGRAEACRVWVGPKPPEDEPADGSIVRKEQPLPAASPEEPLPAASPEEPAPVEGEVAEESVP